MNNIAEMDYEEFKYAIASIFNLDLDRDLFDIQEDVFNILQNKELLEFNQEKQIELYKLKIEDNETIECYFTRINENEYEDYIFSVYEDYNEAKKYFEEYRKEEVYEPDV